ncbi:hypothetical protein J1N35_012143 [Gossypium stocksii]|uniref:Aminotransferase-like plant mobile domain-containing protein n=1 Tax=Gossypium stocksii TaxID=47602 RepID=A0A9D4AE09_9ROSI|nr:hypothetical protein J1N35_012143 [Gossypium stocksii]
MSADLNPHAEGFYFFVWGTIIYGPQSLHFGSKEEEEEKEKKEKKERREEEERKRRGGGGEGGRQLREEKRNREGEEEEGRRKRRKNKKDSFRKLRGRVNGVGYSPDARLMPYLEVTGFGSAALTRTFDLRLPIDGDAVTGVSAIAEPAALCYSLLGASSGDAESTFSELKFTWLKANFQHLSDNATKEELVCAARAYIMHIIGGVLMPNSNNNRVHLQYLPLLADLRSVRSYSWGFAVLSMLYRELCRTTDPDAVDIGGCLILLQSWTLYRMPFLASVTHQPYVYPLVNRWSIYPSIGRSYTVPIYRLMIEQHAGEGSNGTTGIGYYDSLVAASTSRIRQCRWRRRFTAKIREGNMDSIGGFMHRRYIAVWESRMAQRPQMDMSSELRPSV